MPTRAATLLVAPLLALLGGIFIDGFVTPAYAATVIYVATTGNDGPACGTAADPCLTVAQAYGQASPGDTIKVAAGTYTVTTGQLLIQKAGLRLEGAMVGVDARTRTVGGPGETVIVCAFTSGGGTFTPDADSVTIDGFTFEGNPNGAGVETTSNYSGYTVINTVFTNNSMGVDPGSNGIQPSVFTRNLYVANNNGFGGNGVFTSDWWALSNASFTDSSFSGNNNTPIDIDGRAARVGVDVATGITITGNDMVGEGPIFIVSVTDAKISDNTTTGGFSGVELSGNDHNVTVTNNTITDKTHGSVVVVTSNDQRPNTNVTIADNTMERTATAAGRAAIDISGSSAIAITSNLILDSGNNGIAVGIRGEAEQPGLPPLPRPSSDITIMQNTITGSGGIGITIADGAYTGRMVVRFNRIVDNGNSDGLVNDDAAAAVDARWDWWGCNIPDHPQPPVNGQLASGGGPGCGTIKGASASASNVTFAPWLVLTIATIPADVLPGQTVAVASSLARDSDGSSTVGVADSPTPYFRVVPDNFTADNGQVVPATVVLTPQLNAKTSWTVGLTLPTRVCSTVDHQTVCIAWSERSSISLAKSASPTVVSKAGDTVAYSFVVTNTGNVPLTSVTVVDTAFSGSGGAPAITCPVTTLAPAESTTCTATYVVTRTDIDAGQITNTATATGTPPTGPAVESAPSSATVTAATASSTLTVVKEAVPTSVDAAGQVVSYTFEVKNTGNTILTNITVTDTMTAPAGPVPAVSCPVTTLAPGASTTCTATYAVTQADINAGQITNTATAHGTPPTGPTVDSPPSSAAVQVTHQPTPHAGTAEAESNWLVPPVRAMLPGTGATGLLNQAGAACATVVLGLALVAAAHRRRAGRAC
ncbi:DUF7507 domain-containing protein [Catenulispora yoronensis]|uniref:DUF7507 domain-containing protein n=1 Tax=Catenulispora yoronensis TaxID=450799 RepID=UPI0031DCBA81